MIELEGKKAPSFYTKSDRKNHNLNDYKVKNIVSIFAEDITDCTKESCSSVISPSI